MKLKMSNKEIEIKVKVENSQPLLEFLGKTAEFKGEKHQIDEYFSPTHRDFLDIRPVKEWLRLRSAGDRYTFNYKSWHFDEQGHSEYCDEHETEVGDIDKIRTILQALDFRSLVTVDKVRKTWVYKSYEISLDLVQGLGDFVEIEYVGDTKGTNPKKITEEMMSFLDDIGCGKIERDYVGYPFLLLFGEKAEI